MARNGLSKREAQAARAGGSLNYKTGKISLPRSLALKTPIQRISQAQKSQPIATDTGKQFGPFVSEIKRPVISQKRPQFTKPEDLLPKPTVVKNPLAKYQIPVQKPQKPKIKKTQSEKYIESLGKPDLSFDKLKELPSDGVKETKAERKASEIHAAIEAIRPATKSINYAGSIENKNKTSYTKDILKRPNVVQNQSVIASRPKGMSKREFAVNTPRSIEESQRNKNKVIDTPYEIGKGVLQGTARDLVSGQLSVASGIQKYGKNKGGFTGRLAEIINRRTSGKSPTFNPSKYGLENVLGKDEVGTLRSELKKTQSTLPEGPIKSIAAPVAVYGGFASNFFGGASKGVTKGLVKNLAQETSESVIKNILKSTSQTASRLSDEVLASLSTKIAHASDEEEVISLLKTADGTADAGTQILKPLDEVTPTEKPQTNQIDQTVPTNKIEPKSPTEQTLIEKLPKTVSEIPEGNIGKADQLFREITDGKEEVFVNVYDGGTELKKVKIGEVDELGDFKQSIAEDGRPITEVLDESARNLRLGKKGVTKLSATGDDRAMLKRFSQNRRKEGLLTVARKKKLTSSSDAKLAKTAQDTQAQDYLKSKVERLKEALSKAKSPEEYGRISEQLDEEVSILQNYGKMTPEGRRNILERLQREDPKMTDRITEDYQNVRETAFDVPKSKKSEELVAGDKVMHNGKEYKFVKNWGIDGDKRLIEGEYGEQKAVSPSELEKIAGGSGSSIYGMSHRPTESGAIGSDITMNGEYIPKDAYDHPEFYFGVSGKDEYGKATRESWSAIEKMKGKPDSNITIYRAAPKEELNRGDWVTLSKTYAKLSSFEEGTKVHSFNVKAKDIQFAGDDINEFGYYPSKTSGTELAANSAGAGAGFETDENGNVRYNAEKGLLGLGLGVAGVKGVKALGKKGALVAAQEARLARKIPDELAHNSEAGYQVMAELELAQAGNRNFIGYGSDMQVIGEKSTFPQWVPSELRLRKVFDAVMEHIRKGTVPTTSKQGELYDVVKQEIMRRDGGATKVTKEVDIDKVNRQLSYIEKGKRSSASPKRELGILPVSQEAKALDKGIANAKIKDMDLRRKSDAMEEVISQDKTVKDSLKKWLRNVYKGKVEAQKEFLDFKIPESKNNILAHETGKKYEGRDLVEAKFKELKKRAEDAGIRMGDRENYIPHVYSQTPEQIKKAVAKALEEKGVDKQLIEDYVNGGELPANVAKSLKINPFFTKERTFDTYAEAAKYGLTPKYENMSQLVAHYAEKTNEAIANRKLIDDLVRGNQLTSFPGGNKLAVNIPGSTEHLYANPKIASYLNDYFRNEDALNVLQTGAKYAGNFSRGLQNIVLAGGFPKSNLNFFTLGHVIKSLTTGVGGAVTLNKGTLTSLKSISNLIRSNFTSPSIKYFNTRFQNGIYDKMAQEGIDMSRTVGNFKENNRGFIKFFQKTNNRNILGEGYDRVLQEKTFNSFLPMQTTSVFEDTYRAGLKGGMSEQEASKLAGDTTKQFMGFSDALRGKTADDTLNAMFFAPRFREGLIHTYKNTIRSAVDPRTFGDASFAQNRRLALGMLLTYAGYNYLNEKLTGHYMWDNPTGKKMELMIKGKDGKVYYTPFMPSQLAFFRNIAEAGVAGVEGDTKTAIQKVGSNFSMGAKLVTDILSNKDYFGNEIYDDQAPRTEQLASVAKYLGQNANHPYVKGVWNAILTQNAEKQDIYPTYEKVSKLLDANKRDEANAIINSLSPLDKEAYYEMKKQKLKPMAQVLSEMMELPVRFSSEGKIASQEYYRGLEEVAKTVKAVPEGAARTLKIQEYINNLPAGERSGALFNLRNQDIDTKGVTTSESIIKGKPIYEKIQALYDQGQDDAGDELYNNLSEEDLKNYNEVRQSERTKETERLHELLDSDPKKAVEYVRGLRSDKGDRLYENLTKKGNEEWLAKYESGK